MTKILVKRENSQEVDDENDSKRRVVVKTEVDHREVQFQEKRPWCSIYYYELDQRYGDPFHGEVTNKKRSNHSLGIFKATHLLLKSMGGQIHAMGRVFVWVL